MQNQSNNQSNYDIMRDRMENEFLKYDQEKMIQKFNLTYDEDYLYINFIHQLYRVNRKTGRVEGSLSGTFEDAYHANYNEAMTIFDVLGYSKDDCHLSGQFVKLDNLKGVVQLSTSHTNSSMFADITKYFDEHFEDLSSACEKLGGIKQNIGDLSYQIPLFDFLPIIFQFWESDDEFDAILKVMWDENIIQYIHYETCFFAMSHLFNKLKAEIAN
ncbi:hypothetical protein P261_00150 [Lachnospiraceae bacterium TWA4]|nr:hypothetical protein P261_00150 [Lachnospiraceae bacterium TWA4]